MPRILCQLSYACLRDAQSDLDGIDNGDSMVVMSLACCSIDMRLNNVSWSLCFRLEVADREIAVNRSVGIHEKRNNLLEITTGTSAGVVTKGSIIDRVRLLVISTWIRDLAVQPILHSIHLP